MTEIDYRMVTDFAMTGRGYYIAADFAADLDCNCHNSDSDLGTMVTENRSLDFDDEVVIHSDAIAVPGSNSIENVVVAAAVDCESGVVGLDRFDLAIHSNIVKQPETVRETDAESEVRRMTSQMEDEAKAHIVIRSDANDEVNHFDQ